jgi:hypothetical protein
MHTELRPAAERALLSRVMADLKGVGRAGRLLGVGGACAALLALGPLAAGASAGKTRVAVGTTPLTGANTAGSAQANCPRGSVAVSGGFGQTPAADLTSGHYVNVHDSHRFGARAWRVSGVQYGSATSTLTAYAYCRAQKKPKQVIKSYPLLAAARYQATAVATCPSGLRPISGGFTVPRLIGSTSTFLTEARIFGRHQWVVTGVRSSTSASSDGVVTAYAYCAKGGRPTSKQRTVTGLSAVTPKAPFAADTSACAKGTKPISGGLEAPYTQMGANRGVPVVTDSFLIGSAWRVAALPFGGADNIPLSLTAIVYCR